MKNTVPVSTTIIFHIITLFPAAVEVYIGESILKRAIEDGKIKVKFYNPRDYTVKTGKTWSYADRRVDDRAYGGGPGMVIEALPVAKAIEAAVGKKLRGGQKKAGQKIVGKNSAKKAKVNIIFFSPSGKQLDTAYAKHSARKYTDIVFVCGRYEGIDARVKNMFKMEDISVGPYVLTGGELPAMLAVDTIARQVKGVLGDHTSLEETRIASSDVYTRPEVIEFKGKKYRVPKVLLSGNHEQIKEWRKSINSKK